MIVKNEAANLPRCLSSVRPIADEIIVLDTGSIDNTVAIAHSFNAQVHHFPWTGDFSSARNESLNYVTGDWVLVLDADEVLVEAIAPTIQHAIQSSNVLVVNLLRHEIGATQSPYSLVSRLFRRHPDLHFTRPYHAMIDDSVVALRQREPHWQIMDLPEVAIQHYGYQTEAIASRSKWENARLTMERFLASNPGEPYVCSKLGALYVQQGRPQYGIELLERGLAQGKHQPIEAPVLYELHYHLGLAYTRLHHLEQAAQHYQLALQQPLLPLLKLGASNNLANLRRAMGDLAGAKELYLTCVAIDPNFAIAHHNLGLILKALGNLQEAIHHYQAAIALNPTYAEAHQNLGVVLLKVGRVPESLESFKRAIEFYDAKNPQEADRLRQGLKEMGFQV
jgi:tetratricopeptide (TPR) repeat protein